MHSTVFNINQPQNVQFEEKEGLISKFPTEILLNIFSYLNNLKSCSRINLNWFKASDNLASNQPIVFAHKLSSFFREVLKNPEIYHLSGDQILLLEKIKFDEFEFRKNGQFCISDNPLKHFKVEDYTLSKIKDACDLLEKNSKANWKLAHHFMNLNANSFPRKDIHSLWVCSIIRKLDIKETLIDCINGNPISPQEIKKYILPYMSIDDLLPLIDVSQNPEEGAKAVLDRLADLKIENTTPAIWNRIEDKTSFIANSIQKWLNWHNDVDSTWMFIKNSLTNKNELIEVFKKNKLNIKVINPNKLNVIFTRLNNLKTFNIDELKDIALSLNTHKILSILTNRYIIENKINLALELIENQELLIKNNSEALETVDTLNKIAALYANAGDYETAFQTVCWSNRIQKKIIDSSYFEQGCQIF